MTKSAQQDTPALTPRMKVEYAQQALTLVPDVTHEQVMLSLDAAVAATYDEANDFIRGARTHVKAAQATRDIEESLDRLAAVIRAAIPHVPARYAADMEVWAQHVEYAGMPEDSSNGLESWAYEIADAMAHIGDSPLPSEPADFDQEA